MITESKFTKILYRENEFYKLFDVLSLNTLLSTPKKPCVNMDRITDTRFCAVLVSLNSRFFSPFPIYPRSIKNSLLMLQYRTK